VIIGADSYKGSWMNYLILINILIFTLLVSVFVIVTIYRIKETQRIAIVAGIELAKAGYSVDGTKKIVPPRG